jgi:hypothetical protein
MGEAAEQARPERSRCAPFRAARRRFSSAKAPAAAPCGGSVSRRAPRDDDVALRECVQAVAECAQGLPECAVALPSCAIALVECAMRLAGCAMPLAGRALPVREGACAVRGRAVAVAKCVHALPEWPVALPECHVALSECLDARRRRLEPPYFEYSSSSSNVQSVVPSDVSTCAVPVTVELAVVPPEPRTKAPLVSVSTTVSDEPTSVHVWPVTSVAVVALLTFALRRHPLDVVT